MLSSAAVIDRDKYWPWTVERWQIHVRGSVKHLRHNCLNYCGRSGIFSTGEFDSHKDQFDAVINVSGVRTGAATTVIRITRRSDTVGTDRTSAFFTMRTDTSICDRDKTGQQSCTGGQKSQDAASTVCILSVAACHVHPDSFSPSLSFSLSLSLYLQDSFHTPLRRGVCVHPDTKLRVLKGVVAGSRVCHQRRHSGYLVMHGLINRVYLQFVTSCNIFAVYW